jgi:hypothetical protein
VQEPHRHSLGDGQGGFYVPPGDFIPVLQESNDFCLILSKGNFAAACPVAVYISVWQDNLEGIAGEKGVTDTIGVNLGAKT